MAGSTLTNLIPDAYAALDVVSRELTGFIGAVTRDSTADRVAAGQTLRSIVAPTNTAGADITPAMSIPADAAQTIGNKSLTIDKNRFFPFSWTNQQQYAADMGPGYLTIQQAQIAQAIRAAVNEIESSIAIAAKNGASRAFGTTAGTAPVLGDFASAKKILDDNGAPQSDRTVVFDTTAGVSLRSTANLFKVNESGDQTLLRQGLLGSLYGFDLRESGQVQTTTKGAMTGALVNGALAIGATAIVFDTGTVNTTGVVAGDIITFANDTNKYVVATGSTSTSGTITINEPGLRIAAADNVAITVFGTSARNIAMSRNAIVLATRLPELPDGGDLALDRFTLTDPRTGLSMELAMYPGFRMATYHLSVCWGVSVFKPEHCAVIVG
jgi:P22 coat protein - gene protein 5